MGLDRPVDLDRLADRVPDLDEDAMAATYAHQPRPGTLGKLDGFAIWLAGVQGRCPPEPLRRRRLVVVAGEHGVADRGVSIHPPDATPRLVAAVRDGSAPCAAIARQVGVGIRVAEAGVRSAAIDREPALSYDDAARAVAAGVAVADEEIDAGADLLLTGHVGVGATTAAAALTCAMTDAEPVEVVGRGSGVDDAGWSRKIAAVRDALTRSRATSRPPTEQLAEVGGADIAILAGLILGAACRRTPVVLDGVVTGVAALVAARLAPTAVVYLLAGHRGPEPAHARCLDALGLTPVLDVGLRVGDGTGALLAVPMLDAAVTLCRR